MMGLKSIWRIKQIFLLFSVKDYFQHVDSRNPIELSKALPQYEYILFSVIHITLLKDISCCLRKLRVYPYPIQNYGSIDFDLFSLHCIDFWI